MNVVIVEDEASAVGVLKSILSKDLPQIKISGVASSVQNAKQLIAVSTPDLLLLDVELPDGDAFELLEGLDISNVKVIFITAYQDYAIQALKISALDYLLKPINPLELVEAVKKAEVEMQKDFDQIRLKTLIKNHTETDQKRLVLKDKNGFHLMNIRDIIRLEALGSYTQFILKDIQPVLSSKNLKEYDELLSPYGFFRCHKSHLVNLDFVQSYSRSEGEMLLLRNQTQIPLAFRKKDLLIKALRESTQTV